uniref:Ribosome maturation protein SBDS n=1 Tax=Percolomonas cosmopolitus TaxID=63605 RepID=A0A7S1KTJ5_9EUKA|mmetsp:Transcript_8068/g.29967  ORF Transcript_8068/g.29967 Transcript_8068/m.29967 type:complete len:458 (+) Transcript_8068:65-1438(+)
MRIDTPVNQQRHTNIAVVRSKTKPKFELACYKNKVIDYRNGIEKDLSKVLQTDEIFTKVGEGAVAKTRDLKNVFGTTDKTKIAIEILKHGELQISEKERKLMYETMFRDILNFVVNQCLNPDTKRPYTAGVIEREMKNIHFAVKPNKSTKVQALKLIKKLERKIPIVRARMRLKVVINSKAGTKLKKWFSSLDEDEYLFEKETYNPEDKTILFHVLIDPGLFRQVDEWVVNQASGITEVIDPCVQELGEKSIEEYDTTSSANKKNKLDSTISKDQTSDDEDEGDSHHTEDEESLPKRHDKKSTKQDSDDEQSEISTAQSKKLAKRAARKAKKSKKRHQNESHDEDDNDDESHSRATHDSDQEEDEEIETGTMKPKKRSNKQSTAGGKRASKKDKRREAQKAEKEIPNDPIPETDDLFNEEESELLNTTRELNKNEKRKLRKLKKKKKQATVESLEEK